MAEYTIYKLYKSGPFRCVSEFKFHKRTISSNNNASSKRLKRQTNKQANKSLGFKKEKKKKIRVTVL